MSRRTTIIIVLAFSAIALLIGVYFAWMRSRQAAPPGGAIVPPEIPARDISESEPGPSAAIQLLSDNEVAGYWLVSDPKAMPKKSSTSTAPQSGIGATSTVSAFYIDPDGRVFEAKAGKDVPITSLPVKNVVEIRGGAKGIVLVKHGSELDPKFGVYTSPANKWESLSNISSAALSSDDTRLAYLDTRGTLGTIALTARGVGGRSSLASYNVEDFNVSWAGSGAILLVPKPTALYNGDSIWRFDIKSRAIYPFLAAARGAMIGWSSDGSFGLMSGVDDANNAYLRTVNVRGDTTGNMHFSTFPDKCEIDSEIIYCGVPLFSNNANVRIMPDAYLRREAKFNDAVYKIDVKQNTADFIFGGTSNNPIDVLRPMFENDRLYLINRRDQKLYNVVFGD